MSKESILRATMISYFYQKIQPAFTTHGISVKGSSRYYPDNRKDLSLHLIYQPESFANSIGIALTVDKGRSKSFELEYFTLKSNSIYPEIYFDDLDNAIMACLALELDSNLDMNGY